MVVLDAVHQIQAEQAHDLAVRWNCKAGKCGSCSAEVNGNPRLMCMTRLNQIDLSKPVTLEPMRSFPPIRDLVTDVSWNFRAKKAIKPLQARGRPTRPTAPGGWRRSTSNGCRSSGSASSASCARTSATCCASIGSSTGSSDRAMLVYAAALEMHPLDTEKRAADLKHEHGVGYCNITKCCTKVCPEGITITDNAIIPLKERVIDQLYDPVAKLFRMLRPTSHNAPSAAPLPKASAGVSVSSSKASS